MTDDRREGRGRLSSIDLLPDEAEAEIVWALEQLRERTMPQNAILDEFNARLADRGIGRVSKSAFSRWSVRKALQFRRLDEVRAITADVVAGLGACGSDEVTTVVAEMIKVAIYEQLEGRQDAKSLQALGRSLNAAVAAQKTSADHRRRLEEQAEAQLQKAATVVTDVGRKRGVSEETLREINKTLGVT